MSTDSFARALALQQSATPAAPSNLFLNLKQFGAIGDGVTDDTAAVAAALAKLNSAGGGALFVPRSTYLVSTYFTLPAGVHIFGESRTSSIFKSNAAGGGGASSDQNVRNGSIFYSNWPSNSSTSANIVIEHIGLINTNGANVGAGFYDNGGTFILLRNVRVQGFQYGVIFDQSELSDLEYVDFESQLKGGLWLVNGADLKPGNSGLFTNRTSAKKCQFNQSPTVYGIIDDGGYLHAYEDNNYNGCLIHLRAAGVEGLAIRGGEWESSANECFQMTYLSLAGSGVGACDGASVNGGFMVPSSGQHAINVISGSLEIGGGWDCSTTVAGINGTVNMADFTLGWAHNTGSGNLTDGNWGTTSHLSFSLAVAAPTTGFHVRGEVVWNNAPATGGILGWRCTVSGTPGTWETVNSPSAPEIPQGKSIVFDDINGVSGSGFEGILTRDDISPNAFMTVASPGGTGGWHGAYRVRVSWNGGALFDALSVIADTTGTTATVAIAGPTKQTPLTVASLPAAGTAGRRWFVSDATATTFASIVAGGGTNKVPVYDDGVNWRIG